MNNDTIIALSTPIGNSAIGIIRLSGLKSFELTKNLFEPYKKLNKNEVKPNYTYLGWLKRNNRLLDNVIVIFYKSPHSYTGEDMIEIFAHGGFFNCQKIIKEFLNFEIRVAEKGEFTRRAYLNSKIDLVQCESILELIHSNTDKIQEIAVNNICGKFSKKINDIRNRLIKIKKDFETDIDFSEENLNIDLSKSYEEILIVINELQEIIKNSENNLVYKNGYNIVIAGDTNTGKSSLFNWFLKENRAIVTDIPGTTRDVLKEYFSIEGIPIHLFDTAGLRNTENKIEKIGIEKTMDIVEKSDLILLLFDVSIGKSESFNQIKNKFKNIIVIGNKSDLISNPIKSDDEIIISIKTETGLEILTEKIKENLFSKINFSDEIYTLNLRHISNIKKSIALLENIIREKNRVSTEYSAVDLNLSITHLEEITGVITTEEVLNEIFANFCIGK